MDLLEKNEHDVLSLSGQERAFLADRLLSSLDNDAQIETDLDWIAEAEYRYREYKAGKRPGIEAKDVFAEADQRLK